MRLIRKHAPERVPATDLKKSYDIHGGNAQKNSISGAKKIPGR